MSTMEARGQHAPTGAAAVAETIVRRLELGVARSWDLGTRRLAARDPLVDG